MAEDKQPQIFLGAPVDIPPEQKEFRGQEVATPGSPGIRGFEAQVQQYMPKAREAAEASPIESRITPPYSTIPVVGPAFQKGYSAIEAALGRGEGETFGEKYTSNVAWKEAMDRARQQQFPYSQVATQTAGGLLGALATPTIQLGRVIKPVTDVTGKAVQYLTQRGLQKPAEIVAKVPGAVEKTATGAIYGGTAAYSDIKPGETPEEMAERAALGAVVGGVAPAVVGAGRLAASPVLKTAESFIDPKTAALRDVFDKSKGPTNFQERISPEEFIRRQNAGVPSNISDITGVPERLSAAAARFPDDPRVAQINSNLTNRIAQSGQQVNAAIDSAFGRPVDAYLLRQQADALARQTNAPLYRAAYSHPNAQSIADPTIINALNTNEGRIALQWAENESRKAVAGRNIAPPVNPFTVDSNGFVTLKPDQTGASLEFLDYVKRGLNSVYSSQVSGPNKTTPDVAYRTQKMIDDFTETLKNTVPGYGAALSNAGKYIRGNNAFEAGTEFVNLLPTPGKAVNPGELTAQMEKLNPWTRNSFTPAEREQFSLGLGAWIKENPADAAKIFKANYPKSDDVRRNLERALGTQKFRQIDQSLAAVRTAGMINEIRANMTEARKFSPVQTGVIGGLTGIGAYNVPSIIQYAQQHPYMAAAAAAGVVGAKGISVGANRRLSALLDMAASDDPSVAAKAADTLGKIAAKNTRWEKELDRIENTLGKFLAQSQMMDMNVPGVGPLNYEERKVGRATGGRVTAESLVSAAEQAKKDINKTTEMLLNHDDTTVAHALEVANRQIED